MPRLPRTLTMAPLTLGLAVVATACVVAQTPRTTSAATAASPARPAPAPAGPMDTVLFGLGSSNEGERLFGQECAFCHVGKATGTMMLGRRLGKDQAELVRRTDLDPDYVKAVVRNGLVNMPPFSRVELSDAELDKIAAYLARKRRK